MQNQASLIDQDFSLITSAKAVAKTNGDQIILSQAQREKNQGYMTDRSRDRLKEIIERDEAKRPRLASITPQAEIVPQTPELPTVLLEEVPTEAPKAKRAYKFWSNREIFKIIDDNKCKTSWELKKANSRCYHTAENRARKDARFAVKYEKALDANKPVVTVVNNLVTTPPAFDPEELDGPEIVRQAREADAVLQTKLITEQVRQIGIASDRYQKSYRAGMITGAALSGVILTIGFAILMLKG